MMNKLKFYITEYFNKSIDSIGLDVFRIFYGMTLLGDVLQQFYFKELILDKLPFLDPSGEFYKTIIILWIMSIICIVVGYKTRIAIVLSYIFSVVYFFATREFSYHVFYAYLGINLILIFTPISSNLSLDSFIKIRKNPELHEKIYKVPRFYYDYLVFWGVAIVYFDSVFRKLSSPMWIDGLGMWLPASLPFMVFLNLDFILNQEYLVKFLGYLTIFFEAVMIFIFWFKRFRLPVLVVGMGLHIGIFLAYPIPLFALATWGLYLLLIPVSFWRKIFPKSKEISEEIIPTSKKSKISLLFITFILFIPQVYITSQAGIALGITPTFFNKNTRAKINLLIRKISLFTGVVPHGVFMHTHFSGYNHVIGLLAKYNGKESWIPIINPDGTPGDYLSGSTWVHWTFRVVGPVVQKNNLSKGIIRYTLFWSHKNQIPLDQLKVEILVKKVNIPSNWSNLFLTENFNSKWLHAGDLEFKSSKPILRLSQIEKI